MLLLLIYNFKFGSAFQPTMIAAGFRATPRPAISAVAGLLFILWQRTLACDLDLRTRPTECQEKSACQSISDLCSKVIDTDTHNRLLDLNY